MSGACRMTCRLRRVLDPVERVQARRHVRLDGREGPPGQAALASTRCTAHARPRGVPCACSGSLGHRLRPLVGAGLRLLERPIASGRLATTGSSLPRGKTEMPTPSTSSMQEADERDRHPPLASPGGTSWTDAARAGAAPRHLVQDAVPGAGHRPRARRRHHPSASLPGPRSTHQPRAAGRCGRRAAWSAGRSP